MAAARRKEELREPSSREPERDFFEDVPAAVVCALCGDADCAGCERELSRSGVVALIAWERPGAPVLSSLWLTARGTTRDAERFFETMPDGPIAPALRFAVACELLAASAMVAAIAAVLALVAPDWSRHVVLDPGARDIALRALVAGVPGVATLLVLAHAVHGLALDVGARRAGGRPARSRALRFGLYAAGWDLVLGPLGAAIVILKEGVRPFLSLPSEGVGLPGRGARAFVRGAYRLEGENASRALGVSTFAAVVATLVGAVSVLALVIAFAFL